MPPATPVQAQAQPTASKAVAHQVANHAPLRIQRAPIKGEDLYPGNVADADNKKIAFLLGLTSAVKPKGNASMVSNPVTACKKALVEKAKSDGIIIPKVIEYSKGEIKKDPSKKGKVKGYKRDSTIPTESHVRKFNSQQGIWNSKANFKKPGPWGRPDFKKLADTHPLCEPLIPKWRNTDDSKACFNALPQAVQWAELKKAGITRTSVSSARAAANSMLDGAKAGLAGSDKATVSKEEKIADAFMAGAVKGLVSGVEDINQMPAFMYAPWGKESGWGEPKFKALLHHKVEGKTAEEQPFHNCRQFAYQDAWYPKPPASASYTSTQAEDCWMSLSKEEQQQEILTTSSGPGFSRHHWGTDIDVISTDGFDWENPEMIAATKWLEINAPRFGFYVTYSKDHVSTGGTRVGYMDEAWHLTFQPIGQVYTKDYQSLIVNDLVVIEKLLKFWQGNKIILDSKTASGKDIKKRPARPTQLLNRYTNPADVQKLLAQYALGLSARTGLSAPKIPMPPCALILPKGHPQKKKGFNTYEEVIQSYEDNIVGAAKAILLHVADFDLSSKYIEGFLKNVGTLLDLMEQLDQVAKEANMQGQIDF